MTAAKIETQQAWQTVALAGGPTYSPTTVAYYKDSLGNVHLRGDITTASVAGALAGATLFTLPAGYRPGTTQRFACNRATGAWAVDVTAAGVVTTVSVINIGDALTFSAIQFRAEN